MWSWLVANQGIGVVSLVVDISITLRVDGILFLWLTVEVI